MTDGQEVLLQDFVDSHQDGVYRSSHVMRTGPPEAWTAALEFRKLLRTSLAQGFRVSQFADEPLTAVMEKGSILLQHGLITVLEWRQEAPPEKSPLANFDIRPG